MLIPNLVSSEDNDMLTILPSPEEFKVVVLSLNDMLTILMALEVISAIITGILLGKMFSTQYVLQFFLLRIGSYLGLKVQLKTMNLCSVVAP